MLTEDVITDEFNPAMSIKKSMLLLGILMFFAACNTTDTIGQNDIRKPAVSGSFYPSNPKELNKMLNSFINNDKKRQTEEKSIMGLIVPHAGYIYSGATAGKAFELIKGKKYSTVILLGSSHHVFLDKPATCSLKYWQTPLGKVEVDNKLLGDMGDQKSIMVNDEIFASEHSLEVELPFLQRTLDGNFSIFPVLINEFRINRIKKYAINIAEILKDRDDILFVISTDMSHYFKASEAEIMDKRVNNVLASNDLNELEKILLSKTGQLCGGGGVMLGLLIMKELGYSKIELIDYSHSGMVTGDNNRVVGYGAFSVYGKNGSWKDKLPERQEKKMGYTKEQKITLLKIARDTMESYIREGKNIDINIDDEKLKEKRGAFVTIHKDGQLRGCIGNIMPVDKLYLTISNMAIQSSTRDPRFSPVNDRELDDIEIEISVLTVPEKVRSADDIVLGRDGVIVKKGFQSGVYLPQVADETGWSKEKFLSSLCYSKAGLSPDAWKDKSTELYIFQAEVFNEKELKIR